jgi:hypothetical protein
MVLVPRISRIAFAGLALTGVALFGLAAPASAGGIMPGNGGTIVLPSVLPPSVRDSLSSASNSVSSGFDTLGQKFGVHDGGLDFFSMHARDGNEFKPFLRAGVGDGGLRLQLKW